MARHRRDLGHFESPRKQNHWTSNRVTVGVICALALAGCSDSEPRLVDPSDLEGVEDVTHNGLGRAGDGWTFCSTIEPSMMMGWETAKTELSFGEHGIAGASLVDGNTVNATTADENLRMMQLWADNCAESVRDKPGYVFEPLTGLDADAVGWRTGGGARSRGTAIRGEYVVIKLDEFRLLAVGFSTFDPTDPVDMDELIRLAREGAARIEPDTVDD